MKKTNKLGAAALAVAMTLSALPAMAREAMHAFDFASLQNTPQTLVADYVDTKSPKMGTFSRKETVNGRTRVGVVGFQVVFSETTSEFTEGSTLKGITKGQFADNQWRLQVNNLTPEVRQAITEQMYQDFVTQLSDAGFEVVPRKEVFGNANFQQFVTESMAAGSQKSLTFGKNTVWATVPAGFPMEDIDFSSPIFEGAKPGFVGGLTSGFASIGSTFAKQGRMKDLGAAIQDFTEFTPVSATYFLDFKKLKTTGGLVSNPFGSSDKDSTFGLSATPGSYMRFYTRAGQGKSERDKKFASNYQLNFVLKKPVQMIEPVGAIDFKSENIGSQVLAGTLNVMMHAGGVGGIKTPTRVRKYDLTVNHEAYTKQANQILDAVNKLMISAATDAVQEPAKK